ncbi:ribonuclease HII [Bifidobacterium eulemuris]|uniref:Ribonuclease n=1 Tax=Bifidobacterium eulemuris TaxID=1765219 RepID=A0A261G541_9BIFI|nr:ribonuclease HII [Bifidobacterium eulemuris]OZG66532.1 ribonuclease HII [Bifidobacterium eulemuris]QOL32623.1 ribonuclease HII [Bifidobacterium eulemuris]
MSVSVTPTLDLERQLASRGFDLIVGFDEVGRGALAGPVMVGCAAIWARDLPTLEIPSGVADSKMLTEHRREAMFDELCAWPAAYAVGQASNTEIDEWGITYALGVAALRALNQVERDLGLGDGAGVGASEPAGFVDGAAAVGVMETGSNAPDVSAARNGRGGRDEFGVVDLFDRSNVRVGAILDGPSDYITKALNTFDAPSVPIPAQVTTKVKGDQHCATVAAAAVIAKVTRDRLMTSIAQGNPRYAPYEWAHNKGYGSAAHRAAIAEHGVTPLHRVSWKLR